MSGSTGDVRPADLLIAPTDGPLDKPVVTRGGWTPTGTAAGRRATIEAAPGPKAARTRTRLLDAARAVFVRHGYVDATVELIVAEAGLARGSFYTYFESKLDIFSHLAGRIDQQVERDVVGFDRSTGGDPITNLRISNRSYLAVVRANADLYRLVDELAVHDPSVRAARLRSRRRHVARVARSISRWQAAGWADPTVDADTTAAALVSMLSGFAQAMYVGGEPHDEERALATLDGIVIRACGLAPPASSDHPTPGATHP